MDLSNVVAFAMVSRIGIAQKSAEKRNGFVLYVYECKVVGFLYLEPV